MLIYYSLEVRRGEYWELLIGSIPVAKIPSCQDMKTIALLLHKHEYSWVVKIMLLFAIILITDLWPLSV